MIRYNYIYNQVLQLYRSLDKIIFPIEPSDLITMRSDCRVMTYSKFAEINDCSLQDVVLLCESKSGCTHFDTASNRYLILWNDDSHDYNVSGRKRWTKAHELGHVVLKFTLEGRLCCVQSRIPFPLSFKVFRNARRFARVVVDPVTTKSGRSGMSFRITSA